MKPTPLGRLVRACAACLACASIACDTTVDDTVGPPVEGGAPGQDGASSTGEAGADTSMLPTPDGAPASDSAGPPDSTAGVDASGEASREASGSPSADSGSTGDSSTGPTADAASEGGAAVEGGNYNCAAPPADLASCTTSSNCFIVAKGCYCGQQLEYGVSMKYHSSASACETTAAQHYALGCANFPGHVAQDGRSDVDGGTIAVHCVPVDGGALECQTFVQ